MINAGQNNQTVQHDGVWYAKSRSVAAMNSTSQNTSRPTNTDHTSQAHTDCHIHTLPITDQVHKGSVTH